MQAILRDTPLAEARHAGERASCLHFGSDAPAAARPQGGSRTAASVAPLKLGG